jgi:hypothetical protein
VKIKERFRVVMRNPGVGIAGLAAGTMAALLYQAGVSKVLSA